MAEFGVDYKSIEQLHSFTTQTRDGFTWVPDDASDVCLKCSTPFSLFFRRHHCRVCGSLVCQNCVLEISGVNPYQPMRRNKKMRVCTDCVGTTRTLRRAESFGTITPRTGSLCFDRSVGSTSLMSSDTAPPSSNCTTISADGTRTWSGELASANDLAVRLAERSSTLMMSIAAAFGHRPRAMSHDDYSMSRPQPQALPQSQCGDLIVRPSTDIVARSEPIIDIVCTGDRERRLVPVDSNEGFHDPHPHDHGVSYGEHHRGCGDQKGEDVASGVHGAHRGIESETVVEEGDTGYGVGLADHEEEEEPDYGHSAAASAAAAAASAATKPKPGDFTYTAPVLTDVHHGLAFRRISGSTPHKVHRVHGPNSSSDLSLLTRVCGGATNEGDSPSLASTRSTSLNDMGLREEQESPTRIEASPRCDQTHDWGSRSAMGESSSDEQRRTSDAHIRKATLLSTLLSPPPKDIHRHKQLDAEVEPAPRSKQVVAYSMMDNPAVVSPATESGRREKEDKDGQKKTKDSVIREIKERIAAREREKKGLVSKPLVQQPQQHIWSRTHDGGQDGEGRGRNGTGAGQKGEDADEKQRKEDVLLEYEVQYVVEVPDEAAEAKGHTSTSSTTTTNAAATSASDEDSAKSNSSCRHISPTALLLIVFVLFLVVEVEHGLLGKPAMQAMPVVVKTWHQWTADLARMAADYLAESMPVHGNFLV